MRLYSRRTSSDLLEVAPQRGEVIPQKKVILIPTASREEAHYVCGVLNSSVPNLLLRASAVRVQTIEYAPGDIAQVALPQFQAHNSRHCEIADISQTCHGAAGQGDWAAIPDLERRLDRAVTRLWGITDSQLTSVRQALKELQPAGPNEDESADEES